MVRKSGKNIRIDFMLKIFTIVLLLTFRFYVKDNELKMTNFIVDYDYNAQSLDELTIRKGDIITDAVPAEEGWLKGECRGKIGLFPDNFVTILNKEKEKTRTFPKISFGNKTDTIRKRSLTTNNTSSQNGVLFQVRAVYTYLPIHDDELSIKPNDIINVTRLAEEGWYEGTLDGKTGVFPSNYVTRMHDDKNKVAQSIKQKSFNGLNTLIKGGISKKINPTKARVLYDYKAVAEDELSLTQNDIITVIDKECEDEGWWKGEINGRTGVFPDNYVEEIPSTTDSKQSNDDKHHSETSSKIKSSNNNESNHNYSNECYGTMNSAHGTNDEERLSRISNIDTSKQQRSTLARRPSEKLDNKIIVSQNDINRRHSVDNKNERKVHTPSPPSSQRNSSRYANRSQSLSNAFQTTFSNASYGTVVTVEQLHRDLLKLRLAIDDMRIKYTDQIQDLFHELDQEKKARASLQVEIERLQKLVQKSSRVNT